MSDTEREKRVRLKEQVERLAEERNELLVRAAENRLAIREALRGARKAGWGVTNLERFSGLTRRAIYDVLDGER
jgi:hypothetical protein